MTTTAIDNRASLQGSLALAIATFALAGGLIHVKASFDHRELAVIAIGFAMMAIGQLLLGGMTLVRPTPGVLVTIGALHALIALVWIVSRTTGLAFIPGAEQVAQVGVADVVANTFSIAVVGYAIVAFVLGRSYPAFHISPSTARAIEAVALVGALILTSAALSAPHDHGHDEVEVSVESPAHSDDSHSHESHSHESHSHEAESA